ncbi:MAG: diguanylate cyclase [Desulfovibrionaceae bacterium]|nr:diguanylate cyclase [Desulfovibrionaceae bacterium]
MPTHTEELRFPVASSEALWEWHVPSDRITLSAGALQALRLDEAPATMDAFLENIPAEFLASIDKSRRILLSTPTENFLEYCYPFAGLLLRERLMVLARDDAGHPVRVLGQCTVMGEYRSSQDWAGAISSGWGFWSYDVRAQLISLDARCAELLGFKPEPRVMKQSAWRDRLKDDGQYATSMEKIVASAESDDIFEHLLHVRRENDEYTLIDLHGAVLDRGIGGRALLMAGSMRSAIGISAVSEPDDQVRKRLLLALNVSGDGLWDWDGTTGKVYHSPHYLSMLGYPASESLTSIDTWNARLHPDDYAKVVSIRRTMIEKPEMGDNYECTYRLRKSDGSWVWLSSRGYVIHRDAHGRATRMVGLNTDITAAQSEREHLEELVKNDALTGLRSRAFCDLEVENIERARLRPISVISCDVNGLKLINDYMGHAAGDELLCRAASLLREPLRITDCVARMGGDEFVLLLLGCGQAKAEDILNRIQQGCETANSRGDMPVLISFGLASSSDPTVPVSKLMHDADRIMLQNKNLHRAESQRLIKNWIESNKNVIVSLKDSRYEG